jgi:uracil-DNA glycosylase
MTKNDLLKQIKEEVVNLKESPLYKIRVENKVFPVIGEGNHDAEIMFIGEAPGANEAKTGRPFCGTAGKILTECLEEIGIKREDVYITNILKDRPPQNRDPLQEEIEIYSPFLDRQIEAIKPKIIVTLGRFSMEYILKRYGFKEEIKSISVMQGKPIDLELSYGIIKVLPIFHPAVAIYNRSKKKELMAGFLILKNIR